MHFSYINHEVVQNIYIYTGREGRDHEITDGGGGGSWQKTCLLDGIKKRRSCTKTTSFILLKGNFCTGRWTWSDSDDGETRGVIWQCVCVWVRSQILPP